MEMRVNGHGLSDYHLLLLFLQHNHSSQLWGGSIEPIRLGDGIWFSQSKKHWHGATATTTITHIAVQEQLDGKTVDETYIKVKGQDRYLYRAVDSEGNTLDFLLTALARCTLLPNAFSAKPPIGWRWSASAGSGEYRQHFSDWLGTCWWVFQLIE